MSSLSEIEEFICTREPAELGPGPRTGVEPLKKLNDKLQATFANTELANERQELIRALVLLWHDHLDAAHGIAQGIGNADGAFVHAIMHRREPDYGNAAYWFRRVGRHGAFSQISSQVSEFLQEKAEAKLRRELAPTGEWQPLEFMNACERALSSRDEVQIKLLREVQRIEFKVLLQWFCR